MPRAFICDRTGCGTIITDLKKIAGVERYCFSPERGAPRRQTLDIYLCAECSAQLDKWLEGPNG